jgi:hypothetical protein
VGKILDTLNNIELARKWLSEELKLSGKVKVDDRIYIVSDIRIKRGVKINKINGTEYKCDLTLEEVDKILFYYDSKKEELWCDYFNITSFFKSEFGLKWMDICELCEGMVEEHLKCKVVTTWSIHHPQGRRTLKM